MSDPRPFPSASTSGAYQKSIYEPAWETDFPVRFGVADGAQAFIYHWHDAVEILCGLSGNTTVGVERPYSLEASDVMIIGSGESHCLFPSGREDTRLVLMFDSAFFFRRAVLRKERTASDRSSGTAAAGARKLPGRFGNALGRSGARLKKKRLAGRSIRRGRFIC